MSNQAEGVLPLFVRTKEGIFEPVTEKCDDAQEEQSGWDRAMTVAWWAFIALYVLSSTASQLACATLIVYLIQGAN